MGAVSLRTLGLGRALGLDLARRCTVGLRAIPLRPLGVLSQQTFVESRPVGHSLIVVPRERIEQATVVGTTAQVAPGRRSVLAQPEIVPVRQPQAVVTTRTVVVRRAPPPPPVPFIVRQQALRAQPGRPLDAAALASLRARTPAARPDMYVRPAIPAATAPGAAPALRPAREGVAPTRIERPAPVAEPTPRTERRERRGRPERREPPGQADRRPPMVTPPERAAPAERAVPAERPGRGERRAPGAEPAPAPTASPAKPAERRPRQGERRPAAEPRPEKQRKVEKDTVKERRPQEEGGRTPD